MKFQLAFCLILFFSTNALAQTSVLATTVTFQFEKTRLKDALTELKERYDIKFSYSSKYVNVRQRVTAKVDKVPLSEGLEKLFEETEITYMVIGGHIVLKKDPNKAITETKPKPKKKKRTPEPEEEQPAVLVKAGEPEPEKELEPYPFPVDSVIALEMPETRPIRRKGKMYPGDQTLLNLEPWRRKADYNLGSKGEKSFAQISVLPAFGTNTYESAETTNNISMNLLWGVSGGVDGLEVGGMMNTVRKDVKGFQAAGFGNRVGRNVTGTQVGGIFNKNSGTTTGLQAAGVINLTNDVQAAQAAGAINWARGDVAGLQASGLMNRVGGDAAALQVGGLFNLNKGNAKVQVGGLMNRAHNVEIMQFGGLINVAGGEVKGFQVALINVSDTVSGVPIGLINIVKHGYNKVDIYASETLHGNFQLKLGANAFYNIFNVGAQVPPGDGSYIWGLGYGIGTVTTLSEKTTMNWELMAIHISENETWTNTLNSIGQARFLWNFQIGRSIGFFLGPTANVMVSQLRNPETGKISSPVVPYAIIDEDLDAKTNLKAWVGVNAGFRF